MFKSKTWSFEETNENFQIGKSEFKLMQIESIDNSNNSLSEIAGNKL